MRNKNLDRILQEELNREVKNLDLKNPEKVKSVIKELFTFSTDSFLKNIGSQEAILDEKEEISQENWEWLMQTINESYKDSPDTWNEELKEQKLKILCYKYFTKQDLMKLDSLEKELKLSVKKYFTSLQNFSDLGNFHEKFFNLPFDTLNHFVRLLLNQTQQINKATQISKKELKEKVAQLKEDREKMAKKISMVSKKYQDTIDIGKLKELYENGVFFEDNLVNRGVNEYVVKMLQHKGAAEKIKDKHNSAMFLDLKFHAENAVSYINHVESIRKEETEEYFTPNGFQLGTRFDNDLEVSLNKNKQENYVIDKDSRFKEPSERIDTVAGPGEADYGAEALPGEEGAAGAAGGDGSPLPQGGGGVGLPGGGGLMAGGGGDIPELDADGNPIEGDDAIATADDGTEMPTDENGLPVDFGTPETNPDGAIEGGGDGELPDPDKPKQ
jgi:uncharacterized protein (DUF2384 family)